jgi:cytochrome b561
MQRIARYHPILVILHWPLALLIIAALAFGALGLVKIPNTSPEKIDGLRAHMSAGVVVLVLMLARLFVRSWTAHPPQADAGSPILNFIAWVSHRMLYVLVLAQAGSGLFMALQTHLPEVVFLHQGALPADFWAFPVRSVHYGVSRTLMALIALHVSGALFHTFVRSDGLLGRMWFGRRIMPV